MQAYRIIYTVTHDGELVLHKLPFAKGKKLEVIVIEQPDRETIGKNWRETYLRKILSTSVWSDEVIQHVEQAGKELNKWHVPA